MAKPLVSGFPVQQTINTDKKRNVSEKADFQLRQGDGHCAIEVRLKEELWFEGRDHATLKDLKEGAIAIFAGCVLKRTVGGVSRYQGGFFTSYLQFQYLHFPLATYGTASKAY